MKNETSSPIVEIAVPKQPWTEPTLTILSLPLETLTGLNNGTDGGLAGNNNT